MAKKKNFKKQIVKKQDKPYNGTNNQNTFGFIEIKDNYVIIHAYIKPNNKFDEISQDEDLLIIKTTSTPVKGKANKAIIKLLSNFLNINSNSIEIIAGHTSQKKILKLNNPYNIDFKEFVDELILKFVKN